jgi:hypothetical protein
LACKARRTSSAITFCAGFIASALIEERFGGGSRA